MSSESIHPQTTLGAVTLAVSDLDRSVQFYQETIGMQLHRRNAQAAYLGAGRKALVILYAGAKAGQPFGIRKLATGLYHLAILVPSRLELARALSRLMQTGWPVQGFADHGVSEAVYLADPDGNGIEIYRDFPRSQWPYRDEELQMVTDPLDVQGVMAELGSESPSASTYLHADTMIGHIHLRVADIPAAEEFYCGLLGFDLVQRYGPSASFVSAGGYHHHIGFNTWQSAGAPPLAEGSVGLRNFAILLPDSAELSSLTNRLDAAGLTLHESQDGVLVHDPSLNGVLLTSIS